MYKNKTLATYLNDLAAKLPAPGGGSAAALTAGLGAALLSMVVNFTLGKPKYSQYEEELKQILDKSEKLRDKFLELVDLDVVAYKSGNIRNALNVPFMVCRLCFEAIQLCPALVKKGNQNLASDISVAAILFEAGFSSAYCNVEINLKILGDKKLASSIRKELKTKGKLVEQIRKKTEEKIGKFIGR
jgi:formiminotetrahydrofolate cyclodeaminase